MGEVDTRKCSTAVIAAKTPVTLWRREMAPGFCARSGSHP
jgi:hypothetical protein